MLDLVSTINSKVQSTIAVIIIHLAKSNTQSRQTLRSPKWLLACHKFTD